MSRRSALRLSRTFFLLTALLLTTMVGCWEQWSDTWFPQMKRQKALQAFELVEFEQRIQGFTPPDGTTPIDDVEPAWDPNDEATANALENPQPMTLASLENGRIQYVRYCATCHGDDGLGDGPVSMTGSIRGPFVAVLPVAGPASFVKSQKRSDGHIYSTIRYGRRRMPAYTRIQSSDRWDIVNYLQYLNGRKGIGE